MGTENGSFSLCPAPWSGPFAQGLHVPQLGASTSEGGECCCWVPCGPSGPCGWLFWTQPHVMGHRAKILVFSFLLLAMKELGDERLLCCKRGFLIMLIIIIITTTIQ